MKYSFEAVSDNDVDFVRENTEVEGVELTTLVSSEEDEAQTTLVSSEEDGTRITLVSSEEDETRTTLVSSEEDHFDCVDNSLV